MRKRELRIGVVTFPVSKPGLVPLRNLVDILDPLASNVYLITGGAGYTFYAKNKNVHTYKVEHSAGAKAIFTRALNYAWTQVRISWQLVKLTRNVDFWLFLNGGEGLVLPILAAKLLRKRVAIASAGSGLKVARAERDPLAEVLALLQSITYRLADKLIMYSERLVDEHSLQKYRNKIAIAQKHFVDYDKFKVKNNFEERDNLVGYIGALSKVKGVPNLLEAIPQILVRDSDIKFVIVGDGQLKDKIKKFLDEENLNDKAKLVSWIAHDELPNYLNKLKLLVLPSYTEGLPNIILEAVACGTPVLATPVGGIPDVIKDGETGFIMENNSPECITTNVIRALNHPRLGEIAHNARSLVEKEYTYEKAVERYRNILVNLK